MPSLTYNDIKVIKDISLHPIFVETGSFKGETIFNMEKHFSELHTIEIKKMFYNNLLRKYKGNKIKFHLGDSSVILNSLVKNLNKPAVFFLDGHWSAGNTGKGDKHVPLYEELNSINKNFNYGCIIIIDDYRLFGTGPNNRNTLCNWEDINKETILNILKDRIHKVYHLPSKLHPEDRLVIHLHKMF